MWVGIPLQVTQMYCHLNTEYLSMLQEIPSHVDVLFSYFQGALNISSSQPRAQPPDNRTIQNFVKSYVDEYVGE